jgi:hypothetical protein
MRTMHKDLNKMGRMVGSLKLSLVHLRFSWWEYRIAGNFCGVQFSRMASLQSFRGLIFADVGDHAHCTLYNRTYFVGLIFADSHLSAKTTKIRPHENSHYTVIILRVYISI